MKIKIKYVVTTLFKSETSNANVISVLIFPSLETAKIYIKNQMNEFYNRSKKYDEDFDEMMKNLSKDYEREFYVFSGINTYKQWTIFECTEVEDDSIE